METPGSASMMTRSRARACSPLDAKTPQSMKKPDLKKSKRGILCDVTNESPVVGLMLLQELASVKKQPAGTPEQAPKRPVEAAYGNCHDSPQQPHVGEDVLRAQVSALLGQSVTSHMERTPVLRPSSASMHVLAEAEMLSVLSEEEEEPQPATATTGTGVAVAMTTTTTTTTSSSTVTTTTACQVSPPKSAAAATSAAATDALAQQQQLTDMANATNYCLSPANLLAPTPANTPADFASLAEKSATKRPPRGRRSPLPQVKAHTPSRLGGSSGRPLPANNQKLDFELEKVLVATPVGRPVGKTEIEKLRVPADRGEDKNAALLKQAATIVAANMEALEVTRALNFGSPDSKRQLALEQDAAAAADEASPVADVPNRWPRSTIVVPSPNDMSADATMTMVMADATQPAAEEDENEGGRMGYPPSPAASQWSMDVHIATPAGAGLRQQLAADDDESSRGRWQEDASAGMGSDQLAAASGSPHQKLGDSPLNKRLGWARGEEDYSEAEDEEAWGLDNDESLYYDDQEDDGGYDALEGEGVYDHRQLAQGECNELCAELDSMRVGGPLRGLPSPAGVHTRFGDDSDGECEVVAPAGGKKDAAAVAAAGPASPSSSRAALPAKLAGLPTPKGTHVRFGDDNDDDDEVEAAAGAGVATQQAQEKPSLGSAATIAAAAVVAAATSTAAPAVGPAVRGPVLVEFGRGAAEEEEMEEEMEVEAVHGVQSINGTQYHVVKWRGREGRTWEPLDSVPVVAFLANQN